MGFVGKVAKESLTEVVEEKMGGSGSEDFDETVIFEDGVEDVVEYGSVTRQDELSYIRGVSSKVRTQKHS